MRIPYIIAIMTPAVGISTEQMVWVKHELAQRVTSMMNMGFCGDTPVQVFVVCHDGKPCAWVGGFRRPQGVVVCNSTLSWHVNGEARLIMNLNASMIDEVWCLNAPGQTNGGRCASARLYRSAQEFPHLASKYKLVPSWVPAPPALTQPQKQKAKHETNGFDRTPAPARKAGGSRTTRGGQFGKRNPKKPRRESDQDIPWFDSGRTLSRRTED